MQEYGFRTFRKDLWAYQDLLYALESQIMEQSAVKSFFTGGAAELHDDKMSKLAEPQQAR